MHRWNKNYRENILELVRDGISFKEIIGNYYPDIEIEDIQACIDYAIIN
jgi:uncharacterized protein (DUF433 family)